MGNINEKNASTDEEREVRRSLLEPIKHIDPWTDETEERAVEVALLYDIGTCQSPSPAPRRFQPASDLSSEDDVSSHELVTVRGGSTGLSRTKDEPFEETGNVSLPLSQSIIPETFEDVGMTVSLPFASKMDACMLFTSDIRTLDTVEEFSEQAALLNSESHPSQESLFPLSPEPKKEFQTGRMRKTSALCVTASDRATAVTERVFKNSPLALASNSLLVTPYQVNDISVVPLPPLDKPLGESTAVLSPLVLGLPALVSIGDMELSCQPETDNDRNNELSSPPEVPLKELINFEDSVLVNVSPRAVPFAPRRETVPLPPLSTDDDPNLVVSEIPTLEPAGLGLVEPTPTEPVSSAAHFSPAFPHAPGGAAESPQIGIKSLLPYSRSLRGTSESTAVLASQFKAQLSIQNPAVEDETELLQAAISILNLDSQGNDIPRSSCQAAQDAGLLLPSSQEAQVVTPEVNSQASLFAISKISTYIDAMNIAMKNVELAEVILPPLASQRSLTLTHRSVHEIDDRKDCDRLPGRPYRAKGFQEKNISLISSMAAPTHGSVRSCTHTPDNPNWAIAPVLDPISPFRSGKSHRGRGRRRGKKARMSPGTGSDHEDFQHISGPPKSLQGAHPVGLKLVKEEAFQSTPLPRDQSTSSEELRKITLTNRQKANNWIGESAPVMRSPKSSADRGSHVVASCSTVLMDYGLERVSGGLLDGGEDESFARANPPPALRISGTYIPQEVSVKSLHDRVPIQDDHGSKRTPGSVPTTIANVLAKGHSSCEEDRKIKLGKGKSFLTRSPTPLARRSRSVSIASSLASGVSMKSGVSSSTRLFQRAIEEIGSKNGSLPTYGVPGAACHTQLERQHSEPRGSFNTVVQALDSSLLVSSMPIDAVTRVERRSTRDLNTRGAEPCAKGKVEAVTSSYQTDESGKRKGSNNERFLFTFKPPPSSIGEDDRDANMELQNHVGPLLKTSVEYSAVQAPGSHRGEEIHRPPLSKVSIPTAKYVPPPVRANVMFRHGQVSATFHAREVMTGNGAPVQQIKVPQLSWPCVEADAAAIVTTTSGMNVYAPRLRTPDDAPAANVNQFLNDVMPDVRTHSGTGNDPSAGGVQRTFEEKFVPSNSDSFLPGIARTSATAHVNHSGSGVRPRGAMTPLDLLAVDQKQGSSDPQMQTDVLVSHRRINEYVTNLSLAQNPTQANIDVATPCDSRVETLDPIVATSKNRNFEQARTPFSQMASRSSFATSRLQRPAASTPYPVQNIAHQFQTQRLSANMGQSMFEEFCKRQRQETRTVNGNVLSRLPRRKTKLG